MLILLLFLFVWLLYLGLLLLVFLVFIFFLGWYSRNYLLLTRLFAANFLVGLILFFIIGIECQNGRGTVNAFWVGTAVGEGLITRTGEALIIGEVMVCRAFNKKDQSDQLCTALGLQEKLLAVGGHV